MTEFMQKQITECQVWLEVDTNGGTELLHDDLFDINDYPEGQVFEPGDELFLGMCEDISEYLESDKIYSITAIKGYGARLSAPGYMDCTHWSVHETVKEAKIT